MPRIDIPLDHWPKRVPYLVPCLGGIERRDPVADIIHQARLNQCDIRESIPLRDFLVAEFGHDAGASLE